MTWSKQEFEKKLREVGATRYHNLHPFHKLLHSGKLNKGQVQAWALNRYYYQISIPIKDAALLSRMPTPELRKLWIRRIHDHDGTDGGEGGIDRWHKLTDGLGLERDYVTSLRGLLPATRFAVDAYITFVREKPLLDGITSSLTELFAPGIHKERIAGMLESYDFISDGVMAYFKKRLSQATQDAEYVLQYALENARTLDQQEAVVAALTFKTEVLWVMLDALWHAYISGYIPPGAFVPEDFEERPRFGDGV